MFTGIVETTGRVADLIQCDPGISLFIEAPSVTQDAQLGESISVNGACLTATHISTDGFWLDLVPETLRRTNLGQLKIGSEVNLERSMLLSSRVGGHMVQGHVDTTAKLTSLVTEGNGYLARFEIAPEWLRYIVPKGYITIDGMSITVIDTTDNGFAVTFIPHTYQITRTHHYQVGDLVNIETDILGKYLENFLKHRPEYSNA